MQNLKSTRKNNPENIQIWTLKAVVGPEKNSKVGASAGNFVWNMAWRKKKLSVSP